MESIVSYRNFRDYILDFFNEQKKLGLLTWQSFAERAGFAASSHLKLVCQGKVNLSNEGIEKAANSMNLVGFEKDYFKGLVRFNQAKLTSEKLKAFADMTEIAERYKVKILDEDQFNFFSNWQNAVIREIAPHAPANTKSSNIARQVLPEITAAEAGKALRYLVKTGMLEKLEDGTYRQTDKALSTGDPELASLAIRSFHKKMAEFGLDAIDNIPVTERNLTETVVGITRENYEQIVEEIKIFRKKILAIATQGEDMERVYCLHTNLFPLSHKICERKKDK